MRWKKSKKSQSFLKEVMNGRIATKGTNGNEDEKQEKWVAKFNMKKRHTNRIARENSGGEFRARKGG